MTRRKQIAVIVQLHMQSSLHSWACPHSSTCRKCGLCGDKRRSQPKLDGQKGIETRLIVSFLPGTCIPCASLQLLSCSLLVHLPACLGF